MSLLRDLRHDIAITWGHGGAAELWDVVRRAAGWVYSRRAGALTEQDLSLVDASPAPAGIELRVAADGDWSRLHQVLTTRARAAFRQNVAAGHTCIVAWRGERPVGYTWIAEPGTRPDTLPVPLPRDAVYTWDLWVARRERGRGLGSALIGARYAYGRERGFRCAWRIMLDDNAAVLRAAEKNSLGGVRVVGRVEGATILGRRRTRYEPEPVAQTRV